MQFTEEQIVTLSPDPASLKAGQGLSSQSKWVLAANNERALWGECQGSGKLPYQTQVDIHNIAFKCTCPSRKFPCKHGLGLLLLYVKSKASFKTQDEPSWVSEWLDKRKEKEEKKSEIAAKPVDVEAQAKRADARNKKVIQGIAELQTWIKDIIKSGLLDLPNRAYEYWQLPNKRLVDAQAGGLANMVAELGNYNYFDDSWQYNVLNQLVKIYLLSEAYNNLETLPVDLQQEVKLLIGFNQNKEQLTALEGVKDQWMVLSKNVQPLDKIVVEHNWLWGVKTKKFALFIQFYPTAQLPEQNLLPNTTIDAEVVYYPGRNYRVLLKDWSLINSNNDLVFLQNFEAAYTIFNKSLADNPFMDEVPILIENISFIKERNSFYAVDQQGFALPVLVGIQAELHILAITGGAPVRVFMLINENSVLPLSILNASNPKSNGF